MYPVLILRCELVCLILLIFLYFTSKYYRVFQESKSFRRMLKFAILHVVFDTITTLTVNNMYTVPVWLNWICHMLFYMSALLFSNEICNYVISICYPTKARQMYKLGYCLIAAFTVSLPFLDITYIRANGTYSSSGSAAFVGYGLGFAFILVAFAIILANFKKMAQTVKTILIPMMVVLIVTEICQLIWHELLFTGGAITIVTVGFFFSLENPAEVFKKKAMTDALTGMHSRSGYEEDMESLGKRFKEKPSEDYIFVFCDINDLRKINNQFGHMEGDNYISLIAGAINSCLVNSSTVYRIGGDEFIAFYYQVDESVVNQELKDLQATCKKLSETLEYTAGVSVGYAKSSSAFESLIDVVKTADYAMYQNKAKIKSGETGDNDVLGTGINYAGLTDKMFDAMCASNDRNYPYITNLETNVTRISPAWKEFFGLDSEFYYDFASYWKDRIHPDDFDGYIQDLISTINGHQKYHNYDYMAKNADGEYVKVSCHGSIYRDSSSGITYFSGFIENYGVDSNADPLTGLPNFDLLTSAVSQRMDETKAFSVMKLRIKNLARINMLYNYEVGNEILVQLSAKLSSKISGVGYVFCMGAVNFSILYDITDREELKKRYSEILDMCTKGFKTEAGIVPLEIAGGALVNEGTRMSIEQMQSGLIYAAEESYYNRRNGLVFCDEFDNEQDVTGIALLSRIHNDALSEMKYFEMRYQPIVDIESRKIMGAEALLRWKNSEYGEIAPDKFIHFIESDPCYYRLGLWIIAMAIRDARKLRETNSDFKINVNITAQQLQNDDFIDNIIGILNQNHYPPEGLVLELTERCKELDDNFLDDRIREIRNTGIKIALDNLGTGYSTTNLLLNIPVDEIKLDKDFVQNLSDHENYQILVKALAEGHSAQGNSYTICFEGVEDEETLTLISKFGNFLAQGYYFSKPLTIENFAEYLKK